MAKVWVTLPGGRVKKYSGGIGIHCEAPSSRGLRKELAEERQNLLKESHKKAFQDSLEEFLLLEEERETMIVWRKATAAHCTRTEVWAKVRPYGEVRVA